MRMIATCAARSILMAAAFAATVAVRMSAQTSASEVPEYGIRATIPPGLPVCWAETATHLHGVGTVLAGSDCENRNNRPAFNIWADGNTQFYSDPLATLIDHPFCAGSRPAWAEGDWANAIGGLKTAICLNERPNGRIEIALAAQAGKWPDDLDDVPSINYTVNFNTTQARRGSDVEALTEFLRSITISPAAH
jgi:hypothetical protein